MKRALLLIFLLCVLPVSLAAENDSHEQGTIVRMRMTDCMGPQHPLMDALSGNGHASAQELCPEYVLVTDKVVYVIVGKNADQLVPLAETTRFHLQRNEVLIRIDDARRESHFRVKSMALRGQWDRDQEIEEAAARAIENHLETVTMVNRNH